MTTIILAYINVHHNTHTHTELNTAKEIGYELPAKRR
jgi:hypothetical protein